MTKLIKTVLFLYLYYAIGCSVEEKASVSQYPISIDSIKVIYNKFQPEKAKIINQSVYRYFGENALFVLLSCKATNVSQDTIIASTTGPPYNSSPYIEKFIQIDSNKYEHFWSPPVETFGFVCDTIYPYHSKLYYIPLLFMPKIEYGDKLYFQFRIRDAGFYCDTDLSDIERQVSYFNNLNKSVIFINLKNSEARVIEDSIIGIYEKYKKNKKYENKKKFN